jgi:hypothetical protein
VPWTFNGSLMFSYALDPHIVLRAQSLPPEPHGADDDDDDADDSSADAGGGTRGLWLDLAHATRLQREGEAPGGGADGEEASPQLRGGTPAVRIGDRRAAGPGSGRLCAATPLPAPLLCHLCRAGTSASSTACCATVGAASTASRRTPSARSHRLRSTPSRRRLSSVRCFVELGTSEACRKRTARDRVAPLPPQVRSRTRLAYLSPSGTCTSRTAPTTSTGLSPRWTDRQLRASSPLPCYPQNSRLLVVLPGAPRIARPSVVGADGCRRIHRSSAAEAPALLPGHAQRLARNSRRMPIGRAAQ